jgi:hemerythrin-like domain-containing protein
MAPFIAWYTLNKELSKSREIMRITKSLRADQDIIVRFLAALGGASVLLNRSKVARPAYFISAHEFIRDYIEDGFFKKEEALIKVLQEGGFPENEGPIVLLRTDYKKSRDAAELLINTAKQWEAGDEVARGELVWAASQYASVLREHFERLKNRIFPLLEQTISIYDEQKVAEGINSVVFAGSTKEGQEKYIKLVETLEDDLSDWK